MIGKLSFSCDILVVFLVVLSYFIVMKSVHIANGVFGGLLLYTLFRMWVDYLGACRSVGVSPFACVDFCDFGRCVFIVVCLVGICVFIFSRQKKS